jgi:S-phase kinase-associated protein 1
MPCLSVELRVTFHLKNEFTPEEEKKVREENEWCDERQ